MQAASRHLALKAVVRLDDMSTEWLLRSNRPPNSSHVNELVNSFKSIGTQSNASQKRILLGVSSTDIQTFLQSIGADSDSDAFRARWRKADNDERPYPCLVWPAKLPKLTIIAGQHRKLAMERWHLEGWEDPLCWAANIYYLDQMPTILQLNMSGNNVMVQKSASQGEVFRDMACALPHLARADTDLTRTKMQTLVNRKLYDYYQRETRMGPTPS